MRDNSIALYILPTTIAEDTLSDVSARAIEIIHQTKHFVVERARTTRRYISSTKPPYSISDLSIIEIDDKEIDLKSTMQSWFEAGHSIGVMSESGMPGIADPGSEAVKIAHNLGVKVIPLVGPNSVMLSLSASGLNGQNFAFNGYLPIKEPELIKRLKTLENLLSKHNQTQIFIETPYRNQRLFKILLDKLSDNITLCVAMDLTGQNEFIRSDKIKNWKRSETRLEKLPTIYLLGQ